MTRGLNLDFLAPALGVHRFSLPTFPLQQLQQLSLFMNSFAILFAKPPSYLPKVELVKRNESISSPATRKQFENVDDFFTTLKVKLGQP